MTRIYIAGPMTGYPELNFPAFHAAANSLRAQGYDAVNRQRLTPIHPPTGRTACDADIAQLVT